MRRPNPSQESGEKRVVLHPDRHAITLARCNEGRFTLNHTSKTGKKGVITLAHLKRSYMQIHRNHEEAQKEGRHVCLSVELLYATAVFVWRSVSRVAQATKFSRMQAILQENGDAPPRPAKCAFQVVLSSIKLTLHATRRTPHGVSRLVHAMPAWSVKTRHAPSQHCRMRGSIPYRHTTTAYVSNEHTHPNLFCVVLHPTNDESAKCLYTRAPSGLGGCPIVQCTCVSSVRCVRGETLNLRGKGRYASRLKANLDEKKRKKGK